MAPFEQEIFIDNDDFDAFCQEAHQHCLKQSTILRNNIANIAGQPLTETLPKASAGIWRYPYEQSDIDELSLLAQQMRDAYDDIVLLGTGGSSLGAKALFDMKQSRYDDKASHKPKLHIINNIDPFNFNQLYHRLNPKKTAIVAISKSGATVETLAQTLLIIDWLNDNGADIARQLVVVSENSDNPLKRLAHYYNAKHLNHDAQVGGRYSVFTVVGILPTLLAGLDAKSLRDGAKYVLDEFLHADDISQHASYKGALFGYIHQTKMACHAQVMMAYSDRLGTLARWYRQLSAESLGKDGYGLTPIYAMGPIDQHSQLQLWLDGPKDKIFTILGGAYEMNDAVISDVLAKNIGADFLQSKRLADVMQASRMAAIQNFIDWQKPVRSFSFDKIDEYLMGALLMHFMLETVIISAFLGINPYDQPAVEHNKKLIYQNLVGN